MANLSQLLPVLSDYLPEILSSNGPDTSFFHTCLLPDKQAPLSGTTLYVSLSSRALAYPHPLRGIHLLLIEDQLPPTGYPFSDCNLLVLHKRHSEDFILSQCVRFMEDREYFLECQNQLLEQVLNGNDLEQIVTTAAELIRNPIIILDLNFRIISYSYGRFSMEEQWLPSFERGYCSFEFVTEFNKHLKNNLAHSSEPFFTEAFPGTSNQYVSRLFSHKKHLGYLITTETNLPLSKLDKKLFTLISNMIANIIYSQNELQKTLTEYSRDLILIECLTGKIKNRSTYAERIRGTEFEIPSSYQVVSIDVTQYTHFNPRKEVLRDYFSSLFPKNWMLWFQGNVVTLIQTDKLNEPLPSLLEKQPDFFREKHLRLGISDVFSELYDISQYYRQSLQALHFSEKLSPDAIFSLYNQYKFYDFVSECHPPNEWATYYSEGFKKALEYDLSFHTSFIETIYRYILASKNLQKTADCLYIHKNTVTYRINRAKELFQLDLDDAHVRFQFLASYSLREMSRLFPIDDGSHLC